MRITFWAPKYLPELGGQQWSTYRLLTELRRLGVNCTVYTCQQKSSHEDDRVLGVERIPGELSEFVRESARRILSSPELGLLHTVDFFRAGIATELAALRLLVGRGIPTVFRVPTLGVASEVIDTAAKKRVIQRLGRIVVLNESMRLEMERLGVRPDRIDYIPNGVDLSLYRPANPSEKEELRRRLRIPEDAVVITYVGRNATRKGLDVLLESFRGIPYGHARLLIVGAGLASTPADAEYVNELKKRDDRVILIDRTMRTADYYRASDVFALLSSREGQPNALLEAMACGLPIVATKIPGIEECVTNRREGMLIPVGQVHAAREAIGGLVCSPQLRQALGGAARKRACLHHDIRKVAEQYLRTYEALIRSVGHG